MLYKTKFQFFPSNVWITEPLGSIDLWQFVKSHKNPRPSIQETFEQIQQAASEGNLKKKDYLKQNKLFYFTPSIYFDGKGRSYDNIISFTGLMVVEFDKIEYAKELKKYIFDAFTSCVCAYISPSGKGCKFIFKIPVVKTVEEYKQYYCGLSYYLDKFKGYDPANYNPALPLFISMDREILYRKQDEVTTWTVRGEKVNSFKPVDLETFEMPDNQTPEITDKIKRLVKRRFHNLDDGGHPMVVRTSTALGGWVGAGYIDLEEALEVLTEAISDSDYLQKGLKGYLKTADQMFNKGIQQPLEWKDKK